MSIIEEPVYTHGVVEKQINHRPLDDMEEEVLRNGWSIAANLLTAAELNEIRQKMDQIYAQQIEEFGQENLHKINDADIVRTMLAYDKIFVDLIVNPKVVEIIERLLKQNFIISSQVGILNRPKEGLYQHAWHRDLQYQHFVCSRPLAIQVLFCIDDFTSKNGGTWVLPGSHKTDVFPSESFLKKYAVQIEAPAGSALVFDSMVYHRAGTNRSQLVRRAINHIYNAPIIHQQINLPNLLQGKYSDDDRYAKVLGYAWGPSDSIQQWRSQRLQRHLAKERK